MTTNDYISIIDRQETEDEYGQATEGGEIVKFTAKCIVERWSTYQLILADGGLTGDGKATIHLLEGDYDIYQADPRLRFRLQEIRNGRVVESRGEILRVDYENQTLEVAFKEPPRYLNDEYYQNEQG